MPRSMRAPALETRTARLKLAIAKRPYWARIGQGISLGYRRNRGPGTWSVRVAKGRGRGQGHWSQVIGTADDFDAANAGAVLNFWQAQDKARALGQAARHGGDGGGKLGTIAQAIEAYEADLKLRGGDTGNVSRIRIHLPVALAAKTVATLAARDFKSWRAALSKADLTPAAINRSNSIFKAALNHAAAHDERIGNARAWGHALASIPDAVESRNVILDEEAIRAIIAGAYQVGAEFGLLVEVAGVTGARVSQLARLEVRDLQAARADPRLMLPSSKKGRGQKKITHRPVPIPPSSRHPLAGQRARPGRLRAVVDEAKRRAVEKIRPSPPVPPHGHARRPGQGGGGHHHALCLEAFQHCQAVVGGHADSAGRRCARYQCSHDRADLLAVHHRCERHAVAPGAARSERARQWQCGAVVAGNANQGLSACQTTGA